MCLDRVLTDGYCQARYIVRLAARSVGTRLPAEAALRSIANQRNHGTYGRNAGTLHQHFPVLFPVALPADNPLGSVSSQHLSTLGCCTTQNERERPKRNGVK